MKNAQMCLSLILLGGCTTTEVVTEYHDRLVLPPAVYLTSCQPPFTAPPYTYGEAVERDPIWLEAWRNCADQIEHLRDFYGYDSALPNTGK
ncbi:hypothetical protein [Vibrio sp. D173a]|uniref:Rz1-like lysis system protein LysC n=1 Tax=Vibrio sp. D173a TaxID=2836349 RepID=UPI00255712B9|nr:hypothetical protein [Vibrio sp. D173a]